MSAPWDCTAEDDDERSLFLNCNSMLASVAFVCKVFPKIFEMLSLCMAVSTLGASLMQAGTSSGGCGVMVRKVPAVIKAEH